MKFLFCIFIIAFIFSACKAGDDDSGDDAALADDSANATDDDSAADDAADDSAVDDTADDDSVDIYPESCADGPVFEFDLLSSPFVVPFPNNLYTLPDATTPTGLRLNIGEGISRPLGFVENAFRWYMDAVNHLSGFSTLGYEFMPVGDEPSGTTLPDTVNPGIGDGVFLMVIDDTSPHFGELAPLQSFWKERSIRLTPWRPLYEKTRYALVATRTLRPRLSLCYRASESMRRIYRDYATNMPPEDWTGARYLPVVDILVQKGLAPADILSISEFTTIAATKGMDDARVALDALAADNPPEVTGWSIQGSGDPALFGFATATLSTPIFKNADTGAWTYDGSGNLLVDHWEDLSVLFSVPAQTANPQGQPYPLILYGHGIMSAKEEFESLAGYYAQQGFAFAGMDAICMGSRYQGTGGEVGEGLCFFDILRPLSWRDNWRETAANYMWLARALKRLGELDLDGNGIPDFDVTHIYYQGHSLGTIIGGLLTPVEENIDAYMMDSAGADFIAIGMEGPEAGPYFDVFTAIEQALPGVKVMDLVEDVGALVQNSLDEADPGNFLNHTQADKLPVLSGRDIYVFHHGAAYDATLGGISGGYYCRAGGWPQLTPFVWDVDAPHASAPHLGSGYIQFPGDVHNGIFNDDALGIALKEQATHYLRTAYDNGVPEIIDAVTP